MSTDNASAGDLYHRVRGTGPGVLFIPGASGDSGNFERVAERLADEFAVVTYDRRGDSRSPALPAGQAMSIAAQADDAGALLEAAGVTPAMVFGTSGGGNILLELVARRLGVVRAARVHEPALIAVRAADQDAASSGLGPSSSSRPVTRGPRWKRLCGASPATRPSNSSTASSGSGCSATGPTSSPTSSYYGLAW